MKRLRFASWIAILAIALNASGVYAQSLFKKAMTEHLKLKSVSCSACHIAGKPKTNRSDFGKLFEKELTGKNVTARLKSAPSSPSEKQVVESAVKKEFIDALKKVVKKEYPGGGTYGEAIKAAKIKGIQTGVTESM